MTNTTKPPCPTSSLNSISAMTGSANDVTGVGEEEQAARKIQRSYRGYRTRRELRGINVAASTRWLDSFKKLSLDEDDYSESLAPEVDDASTSPARKNWQRAVSVAIQAGRDEDQSSEPTSPTRHDLPTRSEVIRATNPKQMDLQYFLEMVDVKHRHGSNLRAYHSVWKNCPSNENFFYWLDYGEGKEVELPHCSRDRLEKDQVRYLSSEERRNYMVKVDEDGLFRWVKNDELVETNSKLFKDSLQGVVNVDEEAPYFRGNAAASGFESSSSPPSPASHRKSEESQISTQEDYELHKATKKFSYIKPTAIYDHFAGSLSVKDGMWIFVADTSFRIYIGIKDPGAFQHSSFLRGGRISAAGMLKIRHGQLRSLAPLSGHYRPHIANFRAFHHSLQERGVDLSRVSITKSYAMLAGIEGYTLTKRKVHTVHEKLDEKLDAAKEKIHIPCPHIRD